MQGLSKPFDPGGNVCPLWQASSRQAPPSGHGDAGKGLACRVPFPTWDTSWQICSRSLCRIKGHSPEILLGPVPPAGVCRASRHSQHSLPPLTEQEQAHQRLSHSTNALQHPDLLSVNHSLDFSQRALSKTTDISNSNTLSRSFCFGSPWWACRSRQDGRGIAAVEWQKGLKLLHARCAAVNLDGKKPTVASSCVPSKKRWHSLIANTILRTSKTILVTD